MPALGTFVLAANGHAISGLPVDFSHNAIFSTGRSIKQHERPDCSEALAMAFEVNR